MSPLPLEDRNRGALLGLAAGDALGTTLELSLPGGFDPITDMALTTFARLRFPGGGVDKRATRWTVGHGPVPRGVDAPVFLTVEDLAVNELRGRFHHRVRTVRVPVRGDRLGVPLPHQPAARLPDRERDRVVDRLLPARYALRGMAQCFPVAVELVLPLAPGGSGIA